jgi:thiamine-monophosphate kinase
MARDRPSGSAEDRLIARYFRPLAIDPGALGLLDDAAVLAPPPGADLVLTTDAIVGGVHFFADDPPGTIAKKALRVNLSDLAAKGARPAGFLLTLALPDAIDEAWLKAFARALGVDARGYGCPLLGGDSVRTPGPVTISITAFGTVPRGKMIRRHGARAGDRIVVTGTIGDAALGLALRKDARVGKRWKLSASGQSHLVDRYLVPRPRNALAEALRRYATAAMDVSDGLAGDLEKLCAVSGVAAQVNVTRVPLSTPARKAVASEPALIETAFTGGDDYEIVATVPARKLAALHAAAKSAQVPLSEIGEITRGEGGARFLDRDGEPLLFKRLSFSHF